MNKILAEGTSQNITVINGKVIDNNNSTFKLNSTDNKKFDIDVMNNGDGFLIRELNKKELIKLLKNNKKQGSQSLVDKLKSFSIEEPKTKRRRSRKQKTIKKKGYGKSGKKDKRSTRKKKV